MLATVGWIWATAAEGGWASVIGGRAFGEISEGGGATVWIGMAGVSEVWLAVGGSLIGAESIIVKSWRFVWFASMKSGGVRVDGDAEGVNNCPLVNTVVGHNRKAFSWGSQVDAVLVEITCVACDVNHHLIDCVISFGSQRLFITLSTQLPIRVPHVVRTLRWR